jgi:NADH-quinone oxidoreductase subunit N
MNPMPQFNVADLAALLPEIVLAGTGCLLMLAGAFFPERRRPWPLLTILALVGAWLAHPGLSGTTRTVFSGALELSAFTRFTDGFLYLATALVLMCAGSYFERDRAGKAEVYALIVWTTLGLSVMAKSLDLVVLFIALELASVCLYVLAGFYRDLSASGEAALKYFITGSFASAILLYGIAFLYGKSGSTSLAGAVAWFTAPGAAGRADGLVSLGFFLIVVGAAFKLGLAPFHAWVPDTYTGAPTPASAFLSVAPKWAVFALLARVVQSATVSGAPGRWVGLYSILAVLSIAWGNLAALAQRDVKRMLAYSGIAHMGYVTIAFAAMGPDALTGVLVYSIAYAFANVGAFSVAAIVTRGEDQPHPINDLSGLAKSRPWHALAMLVFMLSLAGVPPTAGFVGKFLVFGAAISGGHLGLALVGIAGSLVSAAFYLRVVYTMYVRDVPGTPAEPAHGAIGAHGSPAGAGRDDEGFDEELLALPPLEPPRVESDWLAGLGVVAAAFGTLAVGVFPNWITEAALAAAAALLGP